MNSVDYSKADISRARTADYYPGQSTSGPFYNPSLGYSNNLGQSLPRSQAYIGDASQYYSTSRHPAHSYEQQVLVYGRYGYQLVHSQRAMQQPHFVQSQHVKFQVPQQMKQSQQNYQSQQNLQAQSNLSQQQFPTYYNDHARYLAQNQPSTLPANYQRQFLSFRPMMASEINQAPQSRISLNQRSSEPYHEYDFKVYCPACHQEYYNSQVEEHIERHYLYNTEQFKVSNVLESTHANEEIPLPLSNQSRFIYPLVEPQEFECKQLDEVNYLNKYKLHHEEQNKRETDVKVKSQSTQFAKPPLQVRSDNTDVYNCFDNIFSSQNQFSVNDLTKSNTILAKKRELEDWEKLRSQKEGYAIRKK